MESNATPSVLITSSDKKRGRGKKERSLPIKDLALEKDLKVREVDSQEELHEKVKEEAPDMVVVASFGIMIPSETLDLSYFINIHPSLLPKYRGATPIQGAILNGDEKSGTTIIEMNEKMDAGPILGQTEVSLHPKITYKEAEELLAKKGGDLLVELLPSIKKGELKASPQEEEKATYTKVLDKKDGKVDWNEPAALIERKVRALNPQPGVHSKIEDKRMKILEAEIQEQTGDGPFGPPGKIYLGTNDALAVQTGKDFLLIKRLQIEGGNPVNSKDFIQGNMNIMGTVLS